MLYTSDDLVRLGVGLLLAALRLDVWPDAPDVSAASDDQLERLLRLEASVGNAVDINLYSGHLLVGDVPLIELGARRSPFSLILRCEPERLRLHVDVMPLNHYNENNTVMSNTVISSTICNHHNKIVMRPSPVDRLENAFHGCIGNVTLGSHQLITSLCRREKVDNRSKSFVRSVTSAAITSNHQYAVDLVQIGERVKVREDSATRILFKHIYLTPGHKQLGINNYTLVKFDVMTPPEHGRLKMIGSDAAGVRSFTYADILERRIEYRHDGSETAEDTFDFRVKVKMLRVEMREDQLLRPRTVFIDIEAVDDAPQLRAGVHGTVVQMPPGGRVRLSESYLQVWDVDTPARDVWIRVRRIDGAIVLDALAKRLTRFSQAQLLNGEVFLASENGDGEAEFCAIADPHNNCSAEPNVSLTLRITSVAVFISLVANTGLTIPHCSSGAISAQNLSFSSNFDSAELPLRYVVVDQPKFGVLECLRGGNADSGTTSWREIAGDTYQICAQFDQADVENLRVRYRHTSDSRPQSDTIGFQVHCGETSTRVHVFHVNFIEVRFRVFTRIPFLLNATQEACLSADNLLATAFPKSFLPADILYHVVEPPKFGMLSRRIDAPVVASTTASPKFRRIGVSSNFTQEQVNAGTLQYKLHYVQYAPLRDYFVYRLITAAATSELMRFEIAYLPGAHSLSLINRTLIVSEGATQKITNSTLWLETPDESYFLFTLAVAPFNGQLTLANRNSSTSTLSAGDTFTSADISKNRLFYQHNGDETRSDRMRLVAESVSERREMRFSFWLSVSIIAVDDNAPHLRRRYDTEGGSAATAVITLIDESERVLHPSLLSWSDADWTDRVGNGISAAADSRPLLSFHVAELFRDFIICTRDAPELSVRNFTSRQLEERALIVRHLNLKKKTNKLRYTVSDGQHTVASTLRFIASAPFIRLNTNRILIPRNFITTPGYERRFVLLTGAHLTAETNLDTDPDIIGFERLHAQGATSPFRLVDESDGSLRVIDAFTQRDIFARRIFLVLKSFTYATSTLTVPLRISAINDASSTSSSRFSLFGFAARETSRLRAPMILTADVVFTAQIVDDDKDSATPALAANTIVVTLPGTRDSDSDALECAIESAVVVNANLLSVSPSWQSAVNVFDAKFFIVQAPRYGVLTMSWRNSSVANAASHFVDGFRLSDIHVGRLRYVSLNASAERDAFVVRVSVPRNVLSDDGDVNIVGPLRINVRLVDFSQMLLIPSRSLSVKPGGNLTLHAADLRLSVPSDSDITMSTLEYRVMRAPSARQQARVGYLAICNEHDGALVAVQNAFRHAELVNRQVFVIARPLADDATYDADSAELEWELRACSSSIRQAKCSANAKLRVVIDTGNNYAPTIVRNEPLAFTALVDKVTLTDRYLRATDRDTPPAGLKYLVWHVNGGTLRKISALKSNEKGENRDALTSFTQADINAARIEFLLDQGVKELEDVEGRVSFHYLVTDARHQTLPAVFSLTRRRKEHDEAMTTAMTEANGDVGKKSTVTLETNAHLDAAPGIRARITGVTLRAHIPGTSPENVIFQIRRPPLHGRLNIDESNNDGAVGPVSAFTQADINAGRVTYASSADQGAWSQRDAFDFFVTMRHSDAKDEIFTYRIHSSFANLRDEDLPQFVARQDIVVSYGGSIMLNASHLNLTRLTALCDDVLLLRVAGEPRCGRLSRLRDDVTEFTVSLNDSSASNANDDEGKIAAARLTLHASEIESGRDIIYRHVSTESYCQIASTDEIVLRAYAFREKYRPAESLRVVIRIRITPQNIEDIVERFPERLDVVSGSRVILSADQFRVTSAKATDTSQIIYHIIQPPVGGLRLIRVARDVSSSRLIDMFTQLDVDQGLVALEHFSGDNGDDDGDVLPAAELNVLVFQIGKSGATRVLIVHIEPLALQLVNQSDIALVQGKTYVVLNRTHLGATSNGDRTRVVYNVTRPPVNGSLYWVAGDTQARAFTQKNIDNGEILYAQLNMNAFQDSFGFVLINDETETLEREARVIVTAAMPPPRSFVTSARTITQISTVHLNTSHIPYASARFFIVHPPKFGRLFLRADANVSASFFTVADIADGNLFFHAFHVNRREIDQMELELIADDVQPARLSWKIDVRPSDDADNGDVPPTSEIHGFRFVNMPVDNVSTKAANNSSVRLTEINYRFPILILVGMVGVIVAMALCQWRNTSSVEDKQRRTSAANASTGGASSSSHNSEGSDSCRAIPGIGPLRPLPDLDELTAPNITQVASSAKPQRGILTNTASRPSATVAPTAAVRTDLLKSTVYATIGSPNNYVRDTLEGSGGDERVADVRRRAPKLSKSVTLVEDVELSDDDIDTRIKPAETTAARNAPFTAAVRSMIGTSTRRRILPTVDEHYVTTNSAATAFPFNMTHSDEFDTFGQGYYDVSRRATQNVSSLVALNPAARRFILPSRQPVSVSAVVPSNLATSDSLDATAHVKTSTFRPDDNDDDDADFPDVIGPLLSPTTMADMLPFLLEVPSSQARLQQQTQLRTATAAICGRSSSSTSVLSTNDLPMSSNGRETGRYGELATVTPLKENEYWV